MTKLVTLGWNPDEDSLEEFVVRSTDETANTIAEYEAKGYNYLTHADTHHEAYRGVHRERFVRSITFKKPEVIL